MHEDVLSCALDGRTSLAPDELLTLELAQAPFELRRRHPRALRVSLQNTLPSTAHPGAAPSAAPRARRYERRRLLAGSRAGRPPPLRLDHPRVLLREERHAPRALDEAGLRVGGKHTAVEQRLEQPCRLEIGERSKRERERVQLAPPQPSPAGERGARPCGAYEQQRDGVQVVDELVDEVQKVVVRPVESSNTSTVGRCSASASRNRRLPANASCGRAGRRGPRGRRGGRSCRSTTEASMRSESRSTTAARASPSRRRRRPTQDPRLGFHDLAERPVRDPFAVRQRTPLTPRDQVGVGGDDAPQLADEPALADPRDADEVISCALVAANACQRIGEQRLRSRPPAAPDRHRRAQP